MDFKFFDIRDSSKDIDHLVELSYQNYLVGNYEKAYNILEECITIFLKQKNYIQLFICMFNRNIMLRNLKYTHITSIREKYTYVEDYNLEEKFYGLPKATRLVLDFIYQFVNFSYLYEYNFKLFNELRKKEESNKTIKEGGFVFHSDITKTSLKHKNLLYFLIKNRVMIDEYSEFKVINKCSLEISIARQMQCCEKIFSKIEIYSMIRFLSKKDVETLLKCFLDGENYKENKLILLDDGKEWLVEKAFKNLYKELFKDNGNARNYFTNAVFISSITSLEKKHLDVILSAFFEVISNRNNDISIYESINQFLGIQYSLFGMEIDSDLLEKLIEAIIYKIAYKKFNGYDYMAITNNYIGNIYGYAREAKVKFSNAELVNKLLSELKATGDKEKVALSKSFLLNIYEISTPKIKAKIRRFILNINLKNLESPESYLIFSFLLDIKEVRFVDHNILIDLNDFISQHDGSRRFSSTLYQLKNQIDFLVNKNESYAWLLDSLNSINQSINNYQNTKMTSII